MDRHQPLMPICIAFLATSLFAGTTVAADDDRSPVVRCGGKIATIVGTSRGELLNGTPGDDVIHGMGGADTIRGHDGDDTICGGQGDDDIRGGRGNDDIRGGRGSDLLKGTRGSDRVFGGPGRDVILGGLGDDHLFGGTGVDRCGQNEGTGVSLACELPGDPVPQPPAEQPLAQQPPAEQPPAPPPPAEEPPTEKPKSPTVELGHSGLTGGAGVRYKGTNTGKEIYLGVGDLGVGTNRVETEYPGTTTTWLAGTYAVTFAFDKAAGEVMTSIDGPGGPTSLDYTVAAPGCPTEDWDALDILVVDRLAGSDLSFREVKLGGFDLGDFPGSDADNDWTVSGFEFGDGFTVSGDLVVTGVWDGNEKSKLQLTVGCLP